MATSQTRSPLILPTLQSVLIHGWSDVLNALGEGDYRLAWERVQTYYEDVVPPDVEEECKVEYEKLKKKIESAKDTDGIDRFCTASAINANLNEVFSAELREFMNKVKASLFRKKWLTREAVAPRIDGEGHF